MGTPTMGANPPTPRRIDWQKVRDFFKRHNTNRVRVGVTIALLALLFLAGWLIRRFNSRPVIACYQDRILRGYDDGRVTMQDCRNGQEWSPAKQQKHKAAVRQAGFSADGYYAVTIDEKGHVFVWLAGAWASPICGPIALVNEKGKEILLENCRTLYVTGSPSLALPCHILAWCGNNNIEFKVELTKTEKDDAISVIGTLLN